MATTLKTVLHEIVDHLDLSEAHRARLNEDIDLHDDPQAQAEKEKGNAAARAAKRKALQDELDSLEEPAPEPAPVPAPTTTPFGSVTRPPATPSFTPPAQGA